MIWDKSKKAKKISKDKQHTNSILLEVFFQQITWKMNLHLNSALVDAKLCSVNSTGTNSCPSSEVFSFTLYNDPRDFLEDGEKWKWVLSKSIHG